MTRHRRRTVTRHFAGVSDALVFPNTGDTVVPVAASLALLKMVRDHVAAAARFPSLAPTAVHKTAELLRVFNARTAALVLGAGAMRTAGLRSITAKHLALATESVRLFALVTPLLSAARAGASRVEARRVTRRVGQDRRGPRQAREGAARQDGGNHAGSVGAPLVAVAHDLVLEGLHRALREKRGRVPGRRRRRRRTRVTRGRSLRTPKERKARRSLRWRWARRSGRSDASSPGRCARETRPAVLDEVLAHFDESLTGTLREARRSVAKEWMAKMGDAARGSAGREVRGGDPGTVVPPRVVPPRGCRGG